MPDANYKTTRANGGMCQQGGGNRLTVMILARRDRRQSEQRLIRARKPQVAER
jgi:hypothetical protein